MFRSVDLSGKRVVVTGATGFLGGHVLNQLQRSNATVIAVADRRRGKQDREHPATSVETIWFDRSEELAESVKSAKPDYVVHLHAAVTTNRSLAAVRSTLETNLLPSLDLMSACLEMHLERLILIGSGEEFGSVTGPLDDNTVLSPASPYGASKAAISAYAKMFHRAFQLPVVVLRPSVIYGPLQSPHMLIPQVLHALHEKREIAVTGGRQTRDFIHVEDVAKGIVCALVAKGIDGRCLNLASGEVVTVRDCLAIIERITRCEGLIRYGALPYRVSEIFSYEPIAEATFSALKWRPDISLEEGLTETWKSVRDNASLP